jgi:type IV pilus assembly protein PilA
MDRLRLRAEGFTLIELLVVIAIIGILAAIAIPQFAAYRRRGYDSDAKSNVKNMATAQEAYFVDNNTYSSTLGGLTARGFKQSDNITATVTAVTAAKYTLKTQVKKGCATDGKHTFSSNTGVITSAACS